MSDWKKFTYFTLMIQMGSFVVLLPTDESNLFVSTLLKSLGATGALLNTAYFINLINGKDKQ